MSYNKRINRKGYLFIAVFLVVFLTFSIYPVFRTLYLSFTSYKGYGSPEFLGMANYKRVFGDPIFWKAIWNTVKISSVNLIIQIGFALLLTVIFSDMKYRIKGLSIFRALFYLPNLIAATSVAFLFKTILDWKYGALNQILLNAGLINKGIDWLGNPRTAQASVSMIGAWMWFGSTFLLLMAGVQGISKDYYEAAVIDGAGRWTIFSKITLPLLKPIMLYVVITSMIGGLQMFDIPFLMTDGNGSPDRALNTAVMYLYNMAFKNHQVGYAAAIAFVLFGFIMIASLFAFRVMYGDKKEDEK